MEAPPPGRKLFARILGVGILAIPTLTGSAGYAIPETFEWYHRIMQGQPSSWLSLGVVALATLAMFGAGLAMFVL